MTTLEKLGISGIRSFAPREEQAIRFKKPLTIILGHNGAGKTTIIECIKVACTGDLPPFVDKGGAFIHDPRIQSDTETKGKIRMQFTDLAGRKIIVNRQFQLTNKVTTKKQEFKSVEQSVQIVDGKEKLTLSQRHADVNEIVPELMGVTKAVLEHVVFVHQEESTWPLSDARHLKEKFDEIFAATRYTKALDAIRKFKREKTAQLKQKATELDLCKEKVAQAEKLQNEYVQLESQENEVENSIAKLREELQTMESEKNELFEKTQKWNSLRSEVENLRAGRQSYISTLKDIYASMDEEFEETDEELGQFEVEIKEQIQSFQQTKEMRESNVAEYQSKLESHTQRLSILHIEKGHWKASRNLFERKQSDYRQLEQTICGKLMEQKAVELNYEKIEETLDRVIEHWEAIMREKLEELRERESVLRKQCDEKESEAQKMHVQWSVLEHSLKEMRTKLEAEGLSSDQDVNIHSVQQQLENVVNTLESKQHSLEQLRANDEWSKLRSEREELTNQVAKWRKRFSDLCEERTASKSDEEVAGRYMLLISQRDDLHSRIAKLEDEIKKCAAVSDISEVKAMSDGTILDQLDVILDLQRKLEQDEREKISLVSKAESSIESLTKDLSESRTEFVGENCLEVFEKILDEAEEKVRETRETQKQFEGAEEFWKQLLARATRKKCCPTCDRTFSTEEDFSLLIEKLQSRAEKVHQGNVYSSIVQARKNAEEELEQLHKKQSSLNELEVLRNTWKNEMETKTKKQEEYKEWEEKKEIGSKDLLLSKKNKDSLSEIYSFLQKRQSLVDDLKSINTELNQMNANAKSQEISTRSRHLIDEELSICNHELEDCNKRLLHVEQELEKYGCQYNELEEQIKKEQGKREELQEKAKLLQLREEDLCELREQISKTESQVKEQWQLVENADKELKELKSSLETCKDQLVQWKETCSAEINWARDSKKALEVLSEEMNRLYGNCSDDLLQRLEREEETLHQEIQKCKKEISELEESTQKSTSKIYELNSTLKNIEANRNFRKTKAIINDMEKKMNQLQREMTELQQGTDLVAALNDKDRGIQIRRDKSSSLAGKKEMIDDRMKELKKEIHKAQSTRSNEMYREKLVELKTLDLSLKDLEQYHNALDRSLMTFHTLKMKEINKVVKELWQATYRGKDIDYIEIVSDSEMDQSGSKRSYNYRVLMHRGDASLEMRGRCSAGQKILASLVIRLALAESFCLECGILALDEPTTNLDKENIESLANALSDIIRARRIQENFQLILITHDEHFIELLGSREVTDTYYLVERDEDGFSHIRLQDLNVLG
ncbi:DNA repair protein RAD50 [Galdieria sulphuraria]|nr:DNA repair protein RAD50 [Galdieria sulphuraria]